MYTVPTGRSPDMAVPSLSVVSSASLFLQSASLYMPNTTPASGILSLPVFTSCILPYLGASGAPTESCAVATTCAVVAQRNTFCRLPFAGT